MAGTSTTSSSSSSAASFSSFGDPATTTVKFICSYGGRILPRNGKLRYIGGDTRVLAIERCLPFTELQVKLGELCGWGLVSLRCQLPADEMDTLVSVTSDEDLANLYEEYDPSDRDPMHAIKIRAFLFLPRVVEIKGSGNPSIPPPDSVVAQRCFDQLLAPSRSFIAVPARYLSSPHHHDCPARGSRRRQEYRVHHRRQ